MDTRELIAKVRKLEIRTRRIVDELTGGAYHSVFRGRGIEFDEVREYQPGDDVRSIDWNVTARMGHPYLKKYVEERELTVMLVVDVSGSLDVGSGRQRKQDLAAELAALLAFSAIRNHDRVGLLLCSDSPELWLPPRSGRTHVLRLLRELLARPRLSRRTRLATALETCARVLHRRAIVFLISDFDDRGWEHTLRLVTRRHDLVALRIRDLRDQEFPAAGFVQLEDAESGDCLDFASLWPGRRAAFAQAARARQEAAAAVLRRAGVDLVDLRPGEDYLGPLMAFFRRRERRRDR